MKHSPSRFVELSTVSLRTLVVDDDPLMRSLLRAILTRMGHQVDEAESHAEAVARLETKDWELVLCDVNLIDGSGLDVARTARHRCPNVAILMVSSHGDQATGAAAFELGAFGYVVKPFRIKQIVLSIENVLRRREDERERRSRLRGLEHTIAEHNAELSRVEKQITARLLAAAGYRDEETGTHIRRIGLYGSAMAKLLGWSASAQEAIGLAAPMHDVGKIGVPDSILQKPGRLTGSERVSMQAHTLIGAEILGHTGIASLEMAAEISLSHHERWDGTGYPNGLTGEEIPIAARIVAIVDVYDALLHERCYKPAWPEDEALAVMREGRGSQFDPHLFDLFVANLETLRKIRCENPDGQRPSGAEGDYEN